MKNLTIILLLIASRLMGALPTTNLVAAWETGGITQSGGLLTGWNDSSGNGNHITGVPSAPDVVTVAGRTVVRFSADYLTIPTTVSTNARSNSFYAVVRRTNLTSSVNFWCPGDGTVASVNWAGNDLWVNDGANKSSSLTGGFHRCLIGMRCDATNTRIILDGETQTLTVCGVATQTGGEIGRYGGAGTTLTGDVEAMWVYSAALSDDELNDLRNYAASTYGVGRPALEKCFVCEGDSITVGFGLTSPAADRNWVEQFSRKWPSAVKYNQQGTTGQTVATMNTQITAQITPYYTKYSQYGAGRWAVLIGGINDIDGGSSAATVQTEISNWHTSVRSLGYKTLASTVFTAGTLTAGEQTARASLNTWLRANWSTFADRFVDLDADSRLQNAADTTYFQGDQIHPTEAGAGVIATLVFQAMGGMANRTGGFFQ